MYIEIKILKTTTTNRLILVDRKTGMAFISFSNKSKMHKFLTEHHSEKIEDYTPTK